MLEINLKSCNCQSCNWSFLSFFFELIIRFLNSSSIWWNQKNIKKYFLMKSNSYKKLFFWLGEVELILFIIFLTSKNRSQKYNFCYFWLGFFQIRKIQSDQNMMIPELSGIHMNFPFEVSLYSGQSVENSRSPTSPSQKIFWKYFLEKIEIRISNSGMSAIFFEHPCSVLTSESPLRSR